MVDYSVIDLTLGSTSHEALSKRRAAYEAIRYLVCDCRIAPETVAEKISIDVNTLCPSEVGDVESSIILNNRKKTGRAAKHRDEDFYHHNDDRLVFAGRTYVVSKTIWQQTEKTKVPHVLDTLITAFAANPHVQIKYNIMPRGKKR